MKVSVRAAALASALTAFATILACAQNSCINCHSKQEGASGLPTHEWPTSIHSANGISCADCHGGNPRLEEAGDAMDRSKGFLGKPSPVEVPNFCGKCHSTIRDNYMESAHARALVAGVKAPNCVKCHTAHKQQKVTLELINPTTCGECHTYPRAARLKEAMHGMEGELTSMEKREHAVFLEGLDVSQETKSLFYVRNRTHRLTHVLELTKILGDLGAIRPDLQALDSRMKAKEKTISDRKKLGSGVMVLFLIGACIAWAAYKRTMEDAPPNIGAGDGH